MLFVKTIKRCLHRDICRDPVLHGMVLNFYMNGEEYPQRVPDYFPMALADEPEIHGLLEQHLRDEEKHVALYRKALSRIEQPAIEIPVDEIYNSVILRNTSRSSSDGVRERLGDFFAHLHFLEKRIQQSLEIHVEACSRSPSTFSQRAVAVVLEDERRHARYTLDVVHDLVPRKRASELLARNRRAEARANLQFSATQLGMLTRNYASRFPRWRRPIYAFAAHLQELAGERI